MSHAGEEGLRRSLGFRDVYALAIGGVIGTGIFFLPGKSASLMGPAALLAFVIGGALASALVLCFAEVGSRFHGTGGAMTYARAAFGDLVAFEVGWATWIARVVSWAALANKFAELLAGGNPVVHGLFITLLVGVLTVINLRGVGMGGVLNTALTAAKLVPILLFIAVGAFFVDTDNFTPFAPQGYGNLGETTVLLFYAYVGFEGLVIPAAEMRDPQRNVPRALISGMATIAVLYITIWIVCTGTLTELAGAENPVGQAAANFMGSIGTGFVQVGIVISVLGINAFMALVTPRMLYAMSRARLLPGWFGAVDVRQVPNRAICITSLAVFGLALSGTFETLAVISVVARLVQYIPTCLAVLKLRAMADVPAASFRVPFGPTLPLLAVAVCSWLLVEAPAEKRWGGLIAVGAGLLIYGPWRAMRRKG